MKSRKKRIALTNAIAAILIFIAVTFGFDLQADTAGELAAAVIVALGWVWGKEIDGIAIEDAATKAAGEEVDPDANHG